ncbi:hypothetical protein KPH14_002599 [Odynerus spinipes]|uniref:Uncharacterized protein n=1 Tax=Odynerus spinipes TaxID=1348599 RepID=A0AAD9VHM0_9HYME|nr:hypothetical protein KPH14_002599 [Odynerus spinipes]
MANNSGKFAKAIYDKLYKYNALSNLTKVIGNVKERTQMQLNNSLANSTILQELRTIPLKPTNPLPRSLIDWWQWYQHLIGLNTVEKARQQVILIQDNLRKCQEMRRLLRQQAFMINNKTKEIYDELLRTRRDDPKYVSLTIMENKNLQEQSTVTEQLNLLEQEEKDYFVHLTTAINEYQDAQALNAQKYKYLSVVASAIAAILSLICSMIYNNKRINNIKLIISEMQEKNESTIVNCFNNLEEHVKEKLSRLESTINTDKQITPIETTKQSENKWVSIIKRTTYVFSILLMLKGLLF